LFFYFIFYSSSHLFSSSIKRPITTAKGTDRTIHQNHITIAHKSAHIKINREFTPNCFHIKIGVITFSWIHWMTTNSVQMMKNHRIQLWIHARIAIGTHAISGPIYGIISSNHAIRDNEKILGIYIQHSFRINKTIQSISVRHNERISLAFNQIESWL
jgi:hypothetical protein